MTPSTDPVSLTDRQVAGARRCIRPAFGRSCGMATSRLNDDGAVPGGSDEMRTDKLYAVEAPERRFHGCRNGRTDGRPKTGGERPARPTDGA